jgi:hypothetical protein
MRANGIPNFFGRTHTFAITKAASYGRSG